MRISDWSSYVCSSDLCLPPVVTGVVGIGCGVGAGRQPGEDQDRVFGIGIEFAPGLIRQSRAVQFATTFHGKRRRQCKKTGSGRDELGHGGLLGNDGSPEEIGRASCRGRVWTYV